MCIDQTENMSQLVSLKDGTMVKYVGHFLEISYLVSWTDAQQNETD